MLCGQMTPKNGLPQILDSSANAGSRHTSLNSTTADNSLLGLSSPYKAVPTMRCGAVYKVTAPQRCRLLLLLGEGLAQFVLLLLWEVGGDDLEVVVL